MTTGQGWMMAFQAGAPHAQDRGLEAVAYAYREQSFIPAETTWEKPQGKAPAGDEKALRSGRPRRGRGHRLRHISHLEHLSGSFRCAGDRQSRHRQAAPQRHPARRDQCRTIRQTLAENGIDPNLVTLCVARDNETTQRLVRDPAVRSIDFTGGSAFVHWLDENCRQAQLYAELSGVNNVVIDSTDAYKAMMRNIAFTLSLYSGQMCTTTQAILVPADGIATDEGHKSYDDVCADLARAIEGLLGKPEGCLCGAWRRAVARYAASY